MEEYKILILELKNKFIKEINSDEPELIEAFEQYLNIMLEDFIHTDNQILEKNKESIKSYLIAIAESFDEMNLEEKKRELLIDESFEKILMISQKAFKVAIERLNGNDVKIDFDINIQKKELEKLLDSVQQYNLKQAKSLVSEGVLDLNFLESGDAKMISLRLSHMIKNN